MKRIFNILAIVTFAIVSLACTREVDDAFDSSSAERISKALTEYNKVLQSSPNGWLVEFVAKQQYGGYNVICRFNEDNTVTVMNEMTGSDDTRTSHYKLEQSQGAILSFDEYNEYIHYFSDPYSGTSGIGTNGNGMEGDLEFRIMSVASDKIVLKGKRGGSKITMTPVPEGTSWKDLIAELETVQFNMQCGTYELSTPDTTVVCSRNRRSFSFVDAGGNEYQMPFIYTRTGIKLITPLTFKGKEISSFDYNDTKDEMWPESSDNSVILHPVVVPLSQVFMSKDFYVSGANCSDNVLAALAKAKTGCDPYGGMPEFWFGQAVRSDMTGKWGFSVWTGNYIGCWELAAEVIGEDTLKLKVASVGGNAGVFAGGGAFNDIYAILNDTFDIVADNRKDPVILTLKSSSAQITVYPDECYLEL